MKHETQSNSETGAPVDSDRLPPGFYYPLAVYHPDSGGEYVVRDYAGQSGRFCVVGTWTVDILASFKTLGAACAFIVDRAGAGLWTFDALAAAHPSQVSRIIDGFGEQK